MLVLLTAFQAPIAVSAQTETAEEEANRLGRLGVTLFKQGNFKDALSTFLYVHTRKKLPEVTWNIARCYEELGDPESALGYFKEYLDMSSGTDTASRAKGKINAIEDQLKGILTLDVDGTEPFQVRVDEVVIDQATIESGIGLTAGSHDVEVTRPGFEDFQATVDLGPSESRTLEVVMTPVDESGVEISAVAGITGVEGVAGVTGMEPEIEEPEKPGVFLDVLVKPDGADVLLDGRKFGKTPLRNIKVTPGRYGVRVAHEDYHHKDFRIMVEADRAIEGALEFNPEAVTRKGLLRIFQKQKFDSYVSKYEEEARGGLSLGKYVYGRVRSRRNTGVGLTVAGLALEGTGIVLIVVGALRLVADSDALAGKIMVPVGVASSFLLGLPFLIAGGSIWSSNNRLLDKLKPVVEPRSHPLQSRVSIESITPFYNPVTRTGGAGIVMRF